MISTAVFIVGSPCAGKTTLARGLLGPGPFHLVAAPKWTCAGPIVAAGHYTGETFDGGDQVPYSGAQKALSFWSANFSNGVTLTIFDGDRFSHAKAVSFVSERVGRVCCIYLDTPSIVLQLRRADREWSPNAAWLKGRATKAERFAKSFSVPQRRSVRPEESALDVARAFLELS